MCIIIIILSVSLSDIMHFSNEIKDAYFKLNIFFSSVKLYLYYNQYSLRLNNVRIKIRINKLDIMI